MIGKWQHEFQVCKFPKIGSSKVDIIIAQENGTGLLSKYTDGIANTVDTDQTAPKGAVYSLSANFAQNYLSQYLEFLQYSKLRVS